MASIVVVGAGVAGLTCAWRLRRAGHEVALLEREAEAGGRMRSEERGGYRIDRGAQFVASAYRNLHAVAGELSLEGRIHAIGNTSEAVLRGERLHRADPGPALLASGLLSARAKARLLRLPLHALRHARALDPPHPELAAPLDAEDLSAGLRRLVGAECAEYLIEPAFRATFDCEARDLSLAFGLLMLRFFAGGFRLQAFEGGGGTFTRALAERLPVRTGREVFSIESETGGARVRYRARGADHSVLADAVVVAVPGSAVAALCPKLTPEERGFFEGVRYGRGIIAHLGLERPPRTLPYFGVSFPESAGLSLYGVAVDHHKRGAAPPGAGLVNAALTAEAAARHWDAPDAEVVELAIGELAKTPVGRLAPVVSAVHRWSPLLPHFYKGYLPRLARFLRRIDRSPRLAFAGDYLVGATVEGATTSGLRAADEIARGL